jgi:hypothetical protein
MALFIWRRPVLSMGGLRMSIGGMLSFSIGFMTIGATLDMRGAGWKIRTLRL